MHTIPPRTSTGPVAVVISRRVREGHDAQLGRWVRRMEREVQRAPGFLGCIVRPPADGQRDDEWVFTYRFANADALDRWLSSSRRAVLIERSRAHLVSEPVEQRFVEPSPAVSLVSAVRVRQGAEHAHRTRHNQAVAAAAELGGLVRAELFPPVPGGQDDTVALLSFTDRGALHRWLDAPERHAALRDLARFSEGERTVNVVDGDAGWFGTTFAAPRRWKQAVVVLIGLIPVSALLTLTRAAVAPALPLPAVIVLSGTAQVAILTWVVLPVLTRALRPWLTR